MSDKLEAIFAFERDTKNATRFKEIVPEDRQRGIVGTLYVFTSDLAQIGNPSRLKVTIEPAE